MKKSGMYQQFDERMKGKNGGMTRNMRRVNHAPRTVEGIKGGGSVFDASFQGAFAPIRVVTFGIQTSSAEPADTDTSSRNE
jgi:hypothetical protein